MSRQLFALALLLGGIVVAIVRGQENESGDVAPAPLTVSDESSEIWADEPAEPSVFDEEPTAPQTSRYSVAPAAAEEETDGMRSVLKRRPATLSGATADSAGIDDQPGTYSSRRATGSRSSESQPGVRDVPILTARNRRGGNPSSNFAAQPAPQQGLQLKSVGPSLRLEALGPTAIMVGKSAPYRVLVVNESSESAYDVAISIAVPATVGVENIRASAGEATRGSDDAGITWTLPTLAGGAQEQVELQLMPNQDRPFTLGLNWTMRAAALAATIEVQKPALALQITGPDEIIYGARQIYTITISNPGTGPVEDVSLDVATGGGGQAKKLGTIAPGGQEQVRMELIAREAGTLEISATASADGLREEAQKNIVVRRAELAVEITGPAYKFAGTAGEYQIRVSNKGNAPASEVALSLRLPNGVRYAGGLEQATEAAGRLTWTVDELPEGQEQLFTAAVQYEKAGTLLCEISAESAGDLTAAAQCETEIEAVADLTMVVNDPPGPSAVGDEVTYEIRITNRGSKAAEAINVVGQFAQGIEPVRAEGHGAEVVTGQVIFKPIPSIDAGQTIALKIVARADAAGNHRFRAVLKCSDPETELVAEDTTRFFGENAKSAERKTGTNR